MTAPVVYSGTQSAGHSELSGGHLHPPFHYAQTGDPGAVGAGKWWFDTSTNILKVRDATNTAWTSVQPGSHTHPESDVTNLVSDLAGKAPLSHTHTTSQITDLSLASPGAISGKVIAWNGSSAWQDYWVYTATYGPYFLNDVPATATTQAQLMVFNTATAVNLTTNEVRAGRTGYIVGLAMVSDASRTAGTAIARIRLSGVDTVFDGDSCVLGASLPTQTTQIVDPANGVQLSSGGNRIGVNIVTSGWAPTTANIAVWVLVLYSPIA